MNHQVTFIHRKSLYQNTKCLNLQHKLSYHIFLFYIIIKVFLGLLHAPEIVDNHTLAETALIEALKKYKAYITPDGLRHCCDRRDGKGRKIAFIMPYREGLNFLLAKSGRTRIVLN